MAAQESSSFHVEETIPPGYRFMPTDKELLHYLNLKILNKRISTDAIKDVDLYKYHPSDLCQSAVSGTREGYFFTSRTRKYHKGCWPDRTAADGYWKATGGDIIVQSKGQEVGWKKLDKCVCRIYYRTSKSSRNVEQDTQINMIPIQETDVADANLAAASFFHHHSPVPAFDQSSLHGAYLPDLQASFNNQYQLHIPGDQYYPSIPPETVIQSNDQYNPSIPPETSIQSNDQY
ncbi:NAC domain-containing 72-like [Olea europaea subsp. europaea]|uniref:NAC domain-containing 72-like n=1 Tax=Olea europaea subsp. europaea TaxID=158383 RepID=A0A8S0S0L2_OLEEU|nr:NAC domain-containing 72-like [Olea europaea subsp. europaea]